MRPRKQILLKDPAPDRFARTSYALDVWGYRVVTEGEYDAMVTFGQTCVGIRGQTEYIERLYYPHKNEQLREAVKFACIRKRGPKARPQGAR